jgi:LysR family transcriptional regulator, transcriptional activator for bauABCD operon
MTSTDDFTRDLDWNLLKTFHEIVQAGGISKAKDRTLLKQSAREDLIACLR